MLCQSLQDLLDYLCEFTPIVCMGQNIK